MAAYAFYRFACLDHTKGERWQVGSRHSPSCDNLRAGAIPGTDPIVTQMSGLRGRSAHFDLTISYPDLQTRLRMHRRPGKHTTIVKSKSRGMIWTNNTVTDQFAFRKRPTEMRTHLPHGKEAFSTTNKQNGHAIVYYTSRRSLRQF
jgi:hypothetical protein